MEAEPKDNFVVIILNIVGFIFILLAIISFASTSIGGYTGILGVLIFGGTSIPFFFFAQVLDNLIIQTFFLRKIYKDTQKEELNDKTE